VRGRLKGLLLNKAKRGKENEKANKESRAEVRI